MTSLVPRYKNISAKSKSKQNQFKANRAAEAEAVRAEQEVLRHHGNGRKAVGSVTLWLNEKSVQTAQTGQYRQVSRDGLER